MARKRGCEETNVFDKPNDQRELVHFGMARKRGCEETNVFDNPNADELARMVRRENGLMKWNVLRDTAKTDVYHC